jgi:hypothetical protein
MRLATRILHLKQMKEEVMVMATADKLIRRKRRHEQEIVIREMASVKM